MELLKLQENLVKIANGEGITFVTGKGQRISDMKLYEQIEECGQRLMKYKETFGFYTEDTTADSGYCSEKNLLFLRENSLKIRVVLKKYPLLSELKFRNQSKKNVIQCNNHT